MKAFYESAERPDDANTSENAGDVLKKFGAQAAVDNNLTVEVHLGRRGGPYSAHDHLSVPLFPLNVQ
ncbi:hypothetical protein BGLA2_1170025 [Burkholderia gladioli]|nr:hypothetical protein BGLA2_1170025 [Burkholderia gladioli]